MEVLINASKNPIKINSGKEILFSRKFDGEVLGANGTLIRRI